MVTSSRLYDFNLGRLPFKAIAGFLAIAVATVLEYPADYATCSSSLRAT